MNLQLHIVWLLFLPLLSVCQSKKPKNEHISSLNFVIENDLLLVNHTDRYYTNGFELGYTTNKPLFKNQDALFFTKKSKYNTYGFSINSQMYTPLNIREANNAILVNKAGLIKGETVKPILDRPYAGLLMANLSSVWNNQPQSTRTTTVFSLGVLGPAAQQDDVQIWFHEKFNRPIPNWENQLPNDIALNLQMRVDKMVVKMSPFSEILGSMTANVGTVTNAIKLGGTMRMGKLSDYFKGALNEEREFAFFFSPNICFFYDQSLLEGGVFNRLKFNTQNIIPREQIKHVYYEMQFGASVNLKKARLTYSQNMRSPEFKTAELMYWGNITFSKRI